MTATEKVSRVRKSVPIMQKSSQKKSEESL